MGPDLSTPSERRLRSWAKRPFQYSAALHLELAEAALGILIHTHRGAGEGSAPLTLLDPCCGSGTTLYAALNRGLSVVGRDVNPRCVEGSRNNLQYMDMLQERVHLSVQDATISSPQYQPP
eukprot:CAMPEP_0173341986 /NCGR_PEP_ID=MMETSP1144-20121109/9919_1 /TAXON_ID=483371 /ORGANISM="non described non described, Strain CCMP2298" /LENGTH=120 /DNA_ID=CAMNT_0014288455 /DNA_START=65 /DNA_END=424 /DNA_ORIENTATION=+